MGGVGDVILCLSMWFVNLTRSIFGSRVCKCRRSTHAQITFRRDLSVTWRPTLTVTAASYRLGLQPKFLSRVFFIGLQRRNLPKVGFCRTLRQRPLHPNLLSLRNTNRRPNRPADPPTTNTSPTGAPPPTYHWISRTITRNTRSECELLFVLRCDGEAGDLSVIILPCFRAGTREVHNKLEKNRRAHLKECFELLKRQLPVSQDEKKSSNLSILHSALRYIQVT